MSLIIENLTNNINIVENLLTVKELLKSVNYEFNDLYIDRFWDNIENDKWIYIDSLLLKWMGFNRSELKKNKQDYLILIKENFEENIDYKIMFSKEFTEFSKCHQLVLREDDINTHNKTKHLIVSTDCFKQSLMLLKTNKSKEIRKYYTELEKIFKFYLQYQNKYQELKNLEINKKLENKDKELEETKLNLENKEAEFNKFIINQSDRVAKLEKDEYIFF